MVDIWAQQSDTVKGAVLGAIVAMLGIIINGLISGINTGRQLAHDRKQRAEERALSLRRDIYLGVLEHLNNCSTALISITDSKLSYKEIFEKSTESAQFVAKLHLMAKPPLIRAVSDAMNQFMQALVRIRGERQKIERLLTDVENILQQSKSHRGLAGATVVTLRERALSPAPVGDEPALQRRFDQEHAAASALDAQAEAKQPAINRAGAELMAIAMNEKRALLPKLYAVAEAARAEIGESIDMTVYQQIFDSEPLITADQILQAS